MLIERSVIVCQFKLLVGNKMNRVDNWISLNSNIWNLPYLLVKVLDISMGITLKVMLVFCFFRKVA